MLLQEKVITDVLLADQPTKRFVKVGTAHCFMNCFHVLGALADAPAIASTSIFISPGKWIDDKQTLNPNPKFL